MKLHFGPITNLDGVSKDIVVKQTGKDLIGQIAGVVIVVLAITVISDWQFKRGAEAFEMAEYETLEALGLLKN